MYNWTPPRGYKGLRTIYRQAAKVKIHFSIEDLRSGYSQTRRLEMEQWCEDNCRYNWSHVDGYFWFDKTNEAVLFKMIFGGR